MPSGGDDGALFTGLARAHHIGHNVMYRTAECHPPACSCPVPPPSQHEPRLKQLGLALGAMHIARSGTRCANQERAGPWAFVLMNSF